MKKLSIFGPPGTGKTTYLMNLIEKELAGVAANEIAFVSFTRKGTYEGAERAKAQFKLKKSDLLYFRTIHSLCFNALGMSRMDMIDKKHYRLLSVQTGINFTGYYTEDYNSSNDVYLHAAAMERHNKKLANKMITNLNLKRYEYIKFQYQAMKDQLGIVDFDDLLVSYLKKGQPLPVKVAFIDEAQDLTPLQWAVITKMFAKADRVYVAGDDDQAVYEWSGADINGLIGFSKENVILNKSYRMPENILRLAKKITRDISRRKTKEFKSNGHRGEVCSAGTFESMDIEGGELVLARTNWILRKLSFEAINKGLIFKFKGKSSVNNDVLKAISAYQAFSRGTEDSVAQYQYMFSIIDKNMPWQACIKLPIHEVAYYEKLISNGRLDAKPVLFETFHSCKGSENEHVILSCDMSATINESFHNNRDAELRCLYVGLTRSKNKLTLLQPTVKEHYPTKYFT